MSNELQLLNIDKNDQRYVKVWLAAVNPTEFQRLMRFENCELISVPSICDEIAEKLNQDASKLLAAEVSPEGSKPTRSFLVASQFFIGLVYVHQRQVQFVYELVSHYTIPTRFLIESPNIGAKNEFEDETDPLPVRSTSKKGLKRKSSTKTARISKRRISLTFDTSDDHDDIEAQNAKTLDLLQSSVVSKSGDISIHEPEPIPVSEPNEFTYCFDMQFNEDISGSERNDIGNNALLLEDGMMSMTLDQPQDIAENVAFPTDQPQDIAENVAFPTDISESTRFNDTVYRNAAEKTAPIPEEDVVELELGIESSLHRTGDDSIEMTMLEPANATFRKRKRTGHSRPLKDITLSINVKENVKTVATTQRHLCPRDDSISTVSCLRSLTSKIFSEPSHTAFSESMVRKFGSKSMSDKLLQAFKRMTLITKTEATDGDMVQEFCSDLQSSNQQSVIPKPTVDDSVTGAHSYCEQPNEMLLPEIEFSVDGCNSQPIEEVPVSVDPSIYDHPASLTAEPSIYEHIEMELPSSIRQLLVNNETVEPITRCDTDSQKQFASRSRQNKLDWGREGVLKKLMSLWNSGVYPIGMKDIMLGNNQRMSAATAFFSLMELYSARIGLITITKCPDSNVIFNISKSPKLIELQEML
ncbi:hypothetical protein HA402_007820 [Bradysia odoriphaga]|nr:hypothetical protein HA402_007820 [Bradysia odoriphaga]